MTREADYPTLAKLVEELRPKESQKLRASVINPFNGNRDECTIPAFLFRGECKIYPSICSTRHRFDQDESISECHKYIINCIGAKLDQLLQKDLSNMGSASLLQHYGFPTEVIDTTSSIDVAAAFAVRGQSGDQIGRILMYPTDKLMNNAVVIDHSMIWWARRPNRQSGFMIFHKEYRDWQDKRLVEDVHAEERRFISSAEDRRHFNKSDELIGPPEDDPVCGLLHKMIHDVVLADTPHLPREVSDWLNARVPWAPVPMRVVSRNSKGRPMEVEPDFDKFVDFDAKAEISRRE